MSRLHFVLPLLLIIAIVFVSPSALALQDNHPSLWPTAPPPESAQTREAEFDSGNKAARPVGFPLQTAQRPASTMELQDGPGNCGGGCVACLNQPVKMLDGVDQFACRQYGPEPRWADAYPIPWEAFAYGEYVGPHRTPHVPQYRVRVDDEIDFVYQLTREQTVEPYRLEVGDQIQISSTTDTELNQENITILSDGSISLRLIGRVMAARKTIEELQADLNERYSKFFQADPAIVVQGTKTDTRLEDLRDTVDARSGFGGQSQRVTVAPDGTIQLAMIGPVPAVGLTLNELAREINMRYRARIHGIEITPVLATRAPRFIYVIGEVATPGRVELTGPTSAMQAIALAGGWNPGGNLRQIVVFRRDQDWRLMATKLDLAGGLHGYRPHPSDEIWLRDSDIVLVPKMPIQRIADAVDLYFTRTIYGIYPVALFDNVVNR